MIGCSASDPVTLTHNFPGKLLEILYLETTHFGGDYLHKVM